MFMILFAVTSATRVFSQSRVIVNITVDNGTVGRNFYFAPTLTRYYSDGSVYTSTPGPILVSKIPDIVNYGKISSTSPYYISRKDNATDAVVLCSWSYTEDGVTVTTTSTVDVNWVALQ